MGNHLVKLGADGPHLCLHSDLVKDCVCLVFLWPQIALIWGLLEFCKHSCCIIKETLQPDHHPWTLCFLSFLSNLSSFFPSFLFLSTPSYSITLDFFLLKNNQAIVTFHVLPTHLGQGSVSTQVSETPSWLPGPS